MKNSTESSTTVPFDSSLITMAGVFAHLSVYVTLPPLHTLDCNVGTPVPKPYSITFVLGNVWHTNQGSRSPCRQLNPRHRKCLLECIHALRDRSVRAVRIAWKSDNCVTITGVSGLPVTHQRAVSLRAVKKYGGKTQHRPRTHPSLS